jgi:hypothetical protein
MGAHVKVRIERSNGRAVETSAVLNGGFSSEEPSLLLPRAAALLLYPDYPAGTVPHGATTAGGATTFREIVGETVRVRILAGDREGPVADFRVLVSEADDEVLVSDYGIDALGAKIERHGPGIWRFAGENLERKSAPPQLW